MKLLDRYIQQALDLEPLRRDREVPPLGTPHVMAHWLREVDEGESPAEIVGRPVIEMKRYAELLTRLPDRIVQNLERARLERAGVGQMMRAGLGYEELLSGAIADGTAIASSSAEARLMPALLIPANYMQPGGIPGRVLRSQLRGRVTTLTTAATMTLRQRIAATDIITGTVIQATGSITMDTTIQTNTQWEWEMHVVARTAAGSAGTVFGQGDASFAPAALTIANQQNAYSGSAGAAAPAAVTWDMTVGQYLQVTGQWSLATAYSIQAHQYLLEALN